MTNHPVHILNEKGDFSISSFIPFCSFGGEPIGTKIKGFNTPVCDIFKPKNYYDQICYETDLQELKESSSGQLKKQLEMGLILVLDNNEERQIVSSIGRKDNIEEDESFTVILDSISINKQDEVVKAPII